MTIGLQSITGTIEKPHKTYVKLKGLIEEKYHDIKGAIEWLLFDAPDKGNPEYGRKFEKRLTERGKKHALGKSNPSKDILIVSLLEGYERALKKVEEEQEEITHVKTCVGDKVGADRSFPAGRYVVHKMLGKGM